MNLSEELKNMNADEFPCMPCEQPMRDKKTIRLKYVDDTTLGAKVALTELLRLKEETLIPEYFFEEKKKRELTAFEMSDNKNDLHDMIENMEHFVKLSKMKLNTEKTKVMFFNHTMRDGIARYECEGTQLEQVECFKVLGFQLQANMRVTEHVKTMLTKVVSKVWALRTVMQNGGGVLIGKQFYITWIVSLLEYNVPVWHGRLTKNQSDAIENVQKKCFKIILQGGYVNYLEACKTLEVTTLEERRNKLCYLFTKKAMKHHPNLYPKNEHAKTTRQGGQTHMFIPPHTKVLHKNSGKVNLGMIYNKQLDEILRKKDAFGSKEEPKCLSRKVRCKKCNGCRKEDCGVCMNCVDMKKFGGLGKKKQACQERKCTG